MYPQNKGTSSWNFFSKLRTQKISPRHIDRRLSSSKVRDKLDRRRSTKLTIPPSSDARPLQFIAEIVKLCLQQDFVARANQQQLILILHVVGKLTVLATVQVRPTPLSIFTLSVHLRVQHDASKATRSAVPSATADTCTSSSPSSSSSFIRIKIKCRTQRLHFKQH